MALQKQIVPMPEIQGLDTKTDIKQEQPGFLRKAENIVYETLKLLRKRNGYDFVPMDLLGSSDKLQDTKKLAKLGTELLALKNGALLSYSENRMQWTNKGTLYSAETKSNVVYKSAGTQQNVDGIVVDQFKVFAWEDPSLGVRYSVQDLATNSFLVSNGAVETSAERPALGTISGDVYIIYGNAADIKYKKFSILEPQTLSAAVTIASDRHTSTGLIDARSAGTAIACAYNADNSGDNLTIFKINSNGSVSSLIGVTGEDASYALNMYVDPESRLVVTYSDGTDFKYTIYAFNLNAAILAPTLIETVPFAAPTATLNLTADVVLTSNTEGPTRNGDTVTTQVNALAPNPSDTVLVDFTGTVDAVTITITPNDGTNNAATPVNLTTAELVELINTGLVTGKTITLTDSGSLRADLSATGGDATNFANGGEGDGITGTFAGGTSKPTVNCTSIADGVDYKVYYEVSQADANYVKQASLELDGTVSNIAVFCRSVGLAADVFELNDTRYVATVFESATQSSYFLLNEDGQLTTKWANQVAASILTRGVLPSSVMVSDNTVLISSPFRNRLETATGATIVSTTGVGSVQINFAPETCYSNAELAGGLHICAGILKYYDGATVTEHSFTVFPEGLSNPATATSGGFLSDGNRGYKAIYKWTDNNGRDHRSAPTLLPLEVILAGGGSTQTSTIRVPTLRLTDKSNAVLELYRTEDTGLTYYKVTSNLAPVLNDKTVDYIDIVDGLSDTDLLSKEALYTTGDVLENVQAPAAFQVCTYNGDRLAIIGEQANRIYFSKSISEEAPVEFSDAIYRDVSPLGGPITSIINMGNMLVSFSQDACYSIQGEGPTNTGIQDTFTRPETVATDIGCINPDSVVLTPAGVIFKSRKGLWHLSGGLAMNYIGDKVEAYNGDTVTAASIVGDLNQVRFLLSNTRALVYNYNLNRWATFENHGGTSSVVIGNQYYYLRTDGSIYAENRSTFSDVSAPIKLKMETGWMGITELQGFQRIYHALILGQFKSTHKLRVRVAYNFIDAWTQEVVIDPMDFINAPLYGDGNYGDTSPYGGNGALYQVRVDFEQQKCTSIKLSIEDIQGEASEGLTLSAITFRVGAKEGTNKLPATQQVGTE